ncbi:MAG: preprotein translocase subunit YajC [Leptonema sp. (in: Bacteria)]|nr:preprotein translocase subunit YajC [Leptonema sp. (in: bacteria)]
MDPNFIHYLAQQSVESPVAPTAPQHQNAGFDLQSMYMPLMLLAVFGVMYFFSIRPARKEEARKKKLLSALKKGDTVITASGIIGSVHSIKPDTVVLRIGDNARLEMLRSAIQDVRVNDKTVKSDSKENEK